MPTEKEVLHGLGVGGDTGSTDPYASVDQASSLISQFNAQNLSPQEIWQAAQQIPRTVGGVFPEVGAAIPEVGRIPLPFPQVGGVVGKALGVIDTVFMGASGEWQSIMYGKEMNRHHPKLKFLFKVAFVGFTPEVRDFYYFVHRCDKPKVRLQHQDVNYYNFRTRVLTAVTYEPMQITFLDEIGDSVNQFFTSYMRERSGTGGGNWGIQTGFGESTSSKPYESGYSGGERIIIEQVFANGMHTNRFTFFNPRIEAFDFDELSMEENAGSMCNLSFTYDAFTCETLSQSVYYTWGETDLLRGGGTSGPPNGGATSLGESGMFGATSASGAGIGSGVSSITKQAGIAYDALQKGISQISQIPGAISDLVTTGITKIQGYNNSQVMGSGGDTLSSNTQDTLQSIASGDNLQFNGAAFGTFNDRRFSGEVLTDSEQTQILFQNFP